MKILENGERRVSDGVSGIAGSQLIILMPKAFTGTAILGYKDGKDNFVIVEDGTLEAGKQYIVSAGRWAPLLVKITGFATEYEIGVYGKE